MDDNYEIQDAKESIEWAIAGDISTQAQLWYLAKAQAQAMIAQAEATNRLADAAERQATAVERRNELLAEYNKLAAADLDRMNEQRERLLDIFAV